MYFRLSDYSVAFQYTLELDAPESTPVKTVYSLEPTCERVAIATGSGRVFLCDSHHVPTHSARGEGSFILTELGSSGRIVHDLAAVVRPDQKR